MKRLSVEDYLNKIRKKNDKNSSNYDKMIANCPYITNYKQLDELKLMLDELKEENKDFYDYIISLLKVTDDINEVFLLYKEYKDSKIREEILEEEIRNKDIELSKVKKDVKYTNYDVLDFDKEATKLKDMGKILDDLEKTVSVNLDSLFTKLEREENKNLSFGMKALLALGSFLSFKNNKNVLGALLASYLSYKVLNEMFTSNKNKYLNLCEEYLDSLENYMDDALNIEKELVNNLNNVDELESKLKTKYKEYLEEEEFKNIFRMISLIKGNVKRSLDDISKTKDHIDKNIDMGKVKIKQLEV